MQLKNTSKQWKVDISFTKLSIMAVDVSRMKLLVKRIVGQVVSELQSDR